MGMKKSYVVSAAIVLATVVMLFFAAIGIAGSLEPSAAPAPTMKTLDQIPPTWSQLLPAAQRFEVVMAGGGVLDKETGLVWQTTPYSVTQNGYSAHGVCFDTGIGRKGWHLPTIEQLASLVDFSIVGSPKLPAGHPFNNVQPSCYWSATTHDLSNALGWAVTFDDGFVIYLNKNDNNCYIWCVRGGQSYDGY